jgi:protein involved in polysaccharide export with SLBB domain
MYIKYISLRQLRQLNKQKPMRLKFLIAFLFIGFYAFNLSAQNISTEDLSKIKVSQLSDNQILEISKRFEASGMSEDQAIQLLQERGMDPTEATLLKEKMAELKMSGRSATPPPSTSEKPDISYSRDTTYAPTNEHIKKVSLVYGSDFFSNPNLKFEPDIRIATPKNYVLGPDDEVNVILTGMNESSVKSKITPEGNLRIPYVGLIYLNGFTIEQATAQIKAKMQQVYPALANGQTKLTVSLGTVRSIRITIIGEVVQPGTYTLSSLSSLFNALYLSGGPTESGSLRNIEVIRGGQVIETVDFYSFLQKGFLDSNIRLEDQDVIRIPVYTNRVSIDGEVKRPGLYELKTNETLANLIMYAGGFSDRAYKGIAKLTQIDDKERSVKDIPSDLFERYVLKNADSIYFGSILERYTNRVVIEGAVYRPGVFELTAGLSLKELINKAEGLREDAFLTNGYIKRTSPDLEKEMLSFNLQEVMAGIVNDIYLMREDSVVIFSKQDLKDKTAITIGGHVRNPGIFLYREGMSIGDVIAMAHGFKNDAASHRVEVSRLLRNTTDEVSNQLVDVITLDLDSNQFAASSNFMIQPLDYIYVPRLVNYRNLGNVKIRGEVLFPGDYAQQRRDETGLEYIQRAGGVTPIGSLKNAQIFRKGVRVNIDFTDMKSKQNKSAMILMPGDSIFIPQDMPFVEVAGAVNNPQLINYKSRNFMYYVDGAGGTTENARLKGAYVQYANGINQPVKKFLFFRNYPEITPGSKIIVPQKGPAKIRLGFGEISAITSSLAAVVTMVALFVK